jgi:uncharacterized membrane protein YccC
MARLLDPLNVADVLIGIAIGIAFTVVLYERRRDRGKHA